MTKVEQIKAAFDIAKFVAPYTHGLKPTRPGWYVGRCPFHQKAADRPNKRKFWVSSEKQLCGCFVPSCPASEKPMDVINFWARHRGISNREAIEELYKMLPPGSANNFAGDKPRQSS